MGQATGATALATGATALATGATALATRRATAVATRRATTVATRRATMVAMGRATALAIVAVCIEGLPTEDFVAVSIGGLPIEVAVSIGELPTEVAVSIGELPTEDTVVVSVGGATARIKPGQGPSTHFIISRQANVGCRGSGDRFATRQLTVAK